MITISGKRKKRNSEGMVKEKFMYVCSECGVAFETHGDIVQHMTTLHNDVRRIKALLNIRDKQLKKTAHNKPKVRKRVALFRCEHCSYTTQYNTTYNRHLRLHSMEYKQCPHCRYKSVQDYNLRMHIERQHGTSDATTT